MRVLPAIAVARGVKAAAAGTAGTLGWPAVVPLLPVVLLVLLEGGAVSSGEVKYVGKKCGSTHQNRARMSSEMPTNSQRFFWFSTLFCP